MTKLNFDHGFRTPTEHALPIKDTLLAIKIHELLILKERQIQGRLAMTNRPTSTFSCIDNTTYPFQKSSKFVFPNLSIR
ncbi:hypothetical protein CGA22_10880 [Pseudomonas sp. PSB18]|nr:hypothetical protein [Pseudomonas sp. PSB18]